MQLLTIVVQQNGRQIEFDTHRTQLCYLSGLWEIAIEARLTRDIIVCLDGLHRSGELFKLRVLSLEIEARMDEFIYWPGDKFDRADITLWGRETER
jgi:hypothetical protein